MDIMLIGGMSPMMRKLALKLHKEGHKLFYLTGNRNPQIHYEHVFERYDFEYDSASVEEVFRSVTPDVTIYMGAFDGNYKGDHLKQEAMHYASGLQNLLLSWSALEKGRFIYLSSVEVYGASYQDHVSEEVTPTPRGIRPLMIYQGEESCRFYQQQLKKDVLILRVDWIHDVPKNRQEALSQVCGQKCLHAFETGSISYRDNHHYGLTYMGDAIESIYELIACEKHEHGIYHISSSRAFSEKEIAQNIKASLGEDLEIMDDTLEDQRLAVLSNQRIKDEFGFQVFQEPEKTIQKTMRYMKRHSFEFLDGLHPGVGFFRRMYYKIMQSIGALIPYIENLILFVPFFMLNNRATDSQYFSKIDFYLLYVLLFAIVHGQRQATFSAILAVAGHIFREMYTHTGLQVVTDYNTYVWIAEIFILGLVVGYMKDQLQFLKEESQQEMNFMSERLTDICDINDSNVRVKEGLMTQVINYDYSLGTIYDAVEQLEKDQPVEILFRAINMIQKLMDCSDVAIYRVNTEKYARLFGYSSIKAMGLGKTVYLPEKKSLYESIERDEVYVNRSMDKDYPMMAYSVQSEDAMTIVIMLWSIPFERMSIDEANRLIVIGKLIQKSVERADRYLESLRREKSYGEGHILFTEAFEELVQAYRDASAENLTEYILLKITNGKESQEEVAKQIDQMIRITDYIGTLRDGELYVLLTSTDRKGCGYVQKMFTEKGITSIITEERGL